MFINKSNKKYLIYGGSIIFTRGLEFVVLFFAAHYLVKSDYGELEYYKKLIEVGSSFFAFGFPALILSYTKSDASKKHFLLLSVIFVLFLSVVSSIFFGLVNLGFLVVPFVFYAIFFNGGIVPAFLLVFKGSDQASYYKSVISAVFYAVVFISLYYFDVKGQAYVVVNYVLIPIASIYLIVLLYKEQIVRRELKKYWNLFKRLLLSSFTLVVSNFANLMFLYTDIFVIKVLSSNANVEIGDYSFALNVANLLLLIPTTLIQADIEKLKSSMNYFNRLNKKILILVMSSSFLLIGFYYILILTKFSSFNNTSLIFFILLFAKIIHSISSLFGTNLIIHKKFNQNLIINVSMLLFNIVLSYMLYSNYGLVGVAFASVVSLVARYAALVILNKGLRVS